MESLLAQVNQCEEDIDLADERIHNAEVNLRTKERFWFGPQGINWFCKTNHCTYLELQEYAIQQNMQDKEFLHALQYCIDHPDDHEYLGWNPIEPEPTEGE